MHSLTGYLKKIGTLIRVCQIYVQGVHKCALLEPILGLHFAKLTSEVAEIGYMKHIKFAKLKAI